MDKRTVFFVLLVGISFVGLNFFFSWQRDNENRLSMQQRAIQIEKEKLQNKANFEERTAKIGDLPVVTLYADSAQTKQLGFGIGGQDNTLTLLTWDNPLPQTIYVNGSPQKLATLEAVKEGPALYVSPTFQNFLIANLPQTGSYDVQLLTFPEGEPPQVYLGEYINGTLSIPSQVNLTQNALALYKTENGWLPLGFYEWHGRVFIELQNLPLLKGYIKAPPPPKIVNPAKEQRYYVLENAYQQLVFSNVGGSLVEINLPFESHKDKSSVVKEIGFDRILATDYPANAHFPGHPYLTFDSKEIHPPEKVGGYYPLLRRGIWNGKESKGISPQYYALNIVSEYPEMAELVYSVKEFTSTRIVFEAVQPHRKITKIFTLPEGSSSAPYSFDLQVNIEGDSRGLWLSSGIPEVELISNSSSPQIQYRLMRKGKAHVEKLDLPKVKEVVALSSIHPDWVTNSNGYLGVILDPLTDIGSGYKAAALLGTEVPTRLSVIDPQYEPYPTSKYPGYQVLLPFPTTSGSFSFRVYAGPFDEGVLKKVDAIYTDQTTGYNPDYIASWTFYGWFSFISEPFAKFLFVVMKFFYTLTHSWGFSIILLTVFLRLLLYPLNAWSIKSMRRMQQLSPEIQAIQAKHKKDPKKSQMEIMALYREKKVNPFTGCVPILIQIPFLIAMFDLLKSSFQLRGASFIPGWIEDLTAPDVLFSWKTPIFFIGNQLHLLPIFLGLIMFVQQRFFSATPVDPKNMTDQQRQQRAMGTIMTVVFTVMFYHFPSGLNLYWLSSMILGILQQWITNKMLDKKKGVEIIVTPIKKKLSTRKAK
jgi:YidC/Oxa1 family membrane protein insertase